MSSSTFPNRVEIQERNKKTIDNCPPEIGKQLQRAAFDKVAANEFEKTRTTIGDREERSVVKATIDNGSLTIEVEDVVGVVNLTPTSKLQINPKIGWEEILEMFLAIQRRNRSLRYHGIPIDDFLSEDIEISDIFVVIAINYLNSLQPIHRNGFIRQFESEDYDAVTGRGRIDVEQSLLNQMRGIAKHRFVQKNIDYSTPVNSLIHSAGKQLLRLFQDSSSDYNHDQYFQIFSSVREEIRHLEDLGVSSMGIDLKQIKATTVSDLPRQRRYYSDAVKTAKTIISSTTGQSLESGHEDLTIDFILDMDQLFETFTQITLEKEAERLNNLSRTFEGHITIEEEPTIQIFNDSSDASYRPDHVLKNDGGIVAVLDSKYYSRHNDPSLIGEVRSRMFSYAMMLNTTEMAFLSPFGKMISRELDRRDGKVTLVRPGGDFSISSYSRAIREYLESQFDIGHDIEEFRNDFQYPISHINANITGFDDLYHSDILQVGERDPISFARGVRRFAITESNIVGRFDNVSKEKRQMLLQELKEKLALDSEYNYCVPFFVPDSQNENIEESDGEWNGESIKYYFLRIEKGEIVEISDPEFVILGWE